MGTSEDEQTLRRRNVPGESQSSDGPKSGTQRGNDANSTSNSDATTDGIPTDGHATGDKPPILEPAITLHAPEEDGGDESDSGESSASSMKPAESKDSPSARGSRFDSVKKRIQSPLMSSINLVDLREQISKSVEVK